MTLAVKLLIGNVAAVLVLKGFEGAGLSAEYFYGLLMLAKAGALSGLTLLLPLGAI